MTIHEAQQQLLFQLYHIYDDREAANIADWVMERVTGWKKIDRIINKKVSLSRESNVLLDKLTGELLSHKPVQYVLNEAWFCGLKLYVDEYVLIPRPETEELVQLVSSEWATDKVQILDIGTGSGCIAVALKKKLPGAAVFACDVSEKALEVAQRNASTHQTDIQFLQLDFLDINLWDQLPAVNVIVSNPPYVPLRDKDSMRENVVQFEPHLALFVDNNDPLLFYKAIADFAKHKLLPGGAVYAEIHEDLGVRTRELFIEKGFSEAEIKKDMQGKDRMIKAY